MHIQYMLLCEMAREGARGMFDVLGLLDRIYAPRLPAQQSHLAVVALICADGEDDLGTKDVLLRFRIPSGQILLEQRGAARFQPLAGTWLSSVRLIYSLVNLPLPEAGRYFFELTVGPVMANHPLDVVVSQPPAA